MRVQSTIEGIGRDGARVFELQHDDGAAVGAPVRAPFAAQSEVRIEPVRWSVIIAGVFAAVSALAMLALLASAVGLAPFAPPTLAPEEDAATRTEMYVTAAVVAVLAFGAGGWVASRLSVIHTTRTGFLCGALVWAVAVPLVLAGAGTRRAMMLESELTNPDGTTSGAYGPPVRGPATLQRSDVTPGRSLDATPRAPSRAEIMHERAQRSGTLMFIALALALAASVSGALLGSVTSRPQRQRPRPFTSTPAMEPPIT